MANRTKITTARNTLKTGTSTLMFNLVSDTRLFVGGEVLRHDCDTLPRNVVILRRFMLQIIKFFVAHSEIFIFCKPGAVYTVANPT